ncbi:uncharacterized protein YybS (DUF2232 family) [Desulfosalsimonas propionicica]|uniref:Uncharacterized protein YybS (DUF2232 family) n=2 Tax=Desulfosalsimonas propionicica TaxID=332175 RepID=A0A7W0C9S4_9BACT|nr:uncharacterized protein YybS (DUF2232 family) [Desulfosalsimonas propionicica]
MMTTYNPRDILAGTGILALFGAVALYFPILGFACFLLLPLPMLLYRLKLGRKSAGIMAMLAVVVIQVSGPGHVVDLWLILCMIGLGFTMAEALVQNLSVEKTIGYPGALIWTAGLAALLFIGSFSASGPLEMISEYVRRNLELTAAAYETMEMPESSIRVLTESMDRIHYVIMGILPALTASGLIFAGWANLLIARAALRARQLPEPGFGRLNLWKAPDALVWAVIASALLLWVASGPLAFMGANALILLMLIYLFQGIAVISWYFEQKQMPLFLRVLIYVLIAIQQALALMVIGLGFFDTWADFRKINAAPGDHPDPS